MRIMDDTGKVGGGMGGARFIVAAASVVSLLLTGPALAGSWQFGHEERGNPELKYIEDGKATFYMGCGRAFGLHVRYPGKPGEEDKPAAITLSNGRSSMNFKGEFEKPFEDTATTFRQWDLGFTRNDPDLYGTKWKGVRDRLLDILD